MSLTFVCLECRKSYRGGGNCPHCGAKLWRTDDVPRKRKTREWDALRRRFFRWETGFEREFQERVSANSTDYFSIKRKQQQFQPLPEVRGMRKAARKAHQHQKKLRNSLCQLEPSMRCCSEY